MTYRLRFQLWLLLTSGGTPDSTAVTDENDGDQAVARGYAGEEVSVNYHPGSRCWLPDAYRFRDCFDRRWAVNMSDCVLLGYGAA